MIRTVLFISLLALSGCDWMPGRPKPGSQWKPDTAISDFAHLYEKNCLGCHGMGQIISGSISMDNPTYLSVVPREVLLNVISNGIPGKSMPGFSAAAGGPLTGEQIEILVNGILKKKPSATQSALPPYAASLGDATRGATVFANSCAACHGADGTGGEKAGSVVSGYLNMVSAQYLRTIVIAGRSDLGCPDFASRTPGRVMTNEEIADVTAWLVSNRKNEFGKPLVPAETTQP